MENNWYCIFGEVYVATLLMSMARPVRLQDAVRTTFTEWCIDIHCEQAIRTDLIKCDTECPKLMPERPYLLHCGVCCKLSYQQIFKGCHCRWRTLTTRNCADLCTDANCSDSTWNDSDCTLNCSVSTQIPADWWMADRKALSGQRVLWPGLVESLRLTLRPSSGDWRGYLYWTAVGAELFGWNSANCKENLPSYWPTHISFILSLTGFVGADRLLNTGWRPNK